MKKNYIYFLVPLIGLLIFGAVYWNFSKGLAEREARRVAAEKQKKEDKLRKQARDNEQAIKDALAAQAKRKAEREAKEAKDKADKEARALAVEARDKANRDSQKLNQQVERLEKEILTEKDAITKLEAEKKKSADEQAFLHEYVKKAEDNVKNLLQVLDKIAAADAARAAADAAAAAAAKKNS
jgi:preprotein translocase subunit SecF